MRKRTLKPGDYCHEQHELICRMGGYLEELQNTDPHDADRISFLKAVTSTLVLEYQYYNEHYETWLKERREGVELTVLKEHASWVTELLKLHAK